MNTKPEHGSSRRRKKKLPMLVIAGKRLNLQCFRLPNFNIMLTWNGGRLTTMGREKKSENCRDHEATSDTDRNLI